MAFKIENLSIGRGEFNNCCSGSDEPAWHSYVTDDNTGIVSSIGYFPDFLGYNNSFVKPNDILWVGSKANQKGINFLLSSASPVSLINLDQDPPFFSNTYTTNVTSGGTGSLQVFFRKDQYNNVTFGVYSVSLIQTSSPAPSLINFDLVVPVLYRPSSLYSSSTVSMPTIAENNANRAVIPVVYRVGTGLTILDQSVTSILPANTSMIFHNFSMSYVGD